jgi:type VI secretion system protein ImpK
MSSDEPTIPGPPPRVDPDRTLIMPNPAGRRPSSAKASSRAAPATDATEPFVEFSAAIGLNPIVAAANPLLDLVPRLRATLHHNDPRRLLDTLIGSARELEARLTAQGVPAQDVAIAGYLMCTFLDEVISGTPWGRPTVSTERTLLQTLHGERYGGNKVFEVLAWLANDPAGNHDLLGLHYVCLALGFEGRFAGSPNGREQREATAARLARLLGWSPQAGAAELTNLSMQWAPALIAPSRMPAIVPLWVMPAFAVVVMLGVYLFLNADLNHRAAPALRRLVATAAQARLEGAARQGRPRFATALRDDVAAGLLEVRDERMQSIATLSTDRLFGTGGMRIEQEYLPVLARIAKAVNAGAGEVVVVGHTDSAPINSMEYPTNWHLSLAQAVAVASVLAANGVPPERTRPEGRGDAQPRAAGASNADAARNRRIEIQWLLPRPDQ